MRLQRCVRPFALRANANETFARVSSRLAVPLWSLQRLCAARWSLRLWSHHSRPVSCVLRRDTRQRYMPWCMSDGMYVLTRTSHEMLGAPRAHTSNRNLYIYFDFRFFYRPYSILLVQSNLLSRTLQLCRVCKGLPIRSTLWCTCYVASVRHGVLCTFSVCSMVCLVSYGLFALVATF